MFREPMQRGQRRLGWCWRLAAWWRWPYPTYRRERPERSASRPETWRGVHVMAWGLAGGPEGLAPLKEAVDKVLAPLGVNVIVLEVGYNYEFKSHPELRQTKFITKADAQDLARFCRAHGIRVIPQFNCLGHQSWRNTLYPLLTQYRELEETPDDAPANGGRSCGAGARCIRRSIRSSSP